MSPTPACYLHGASSVSQRERLVERAGDLEDLSRGGVRPPLGHLYHSVRERFLPHCNVPVSESRNHDGPNHRVQTVELHFHCLFGLDSKPARLQSFEMTSTILFDFVLAEFFSAREDAQSGETLQPQERILGRDAVFLGDRKDVSRSRQDSLLDDCQLGGRHGKGLLPARRLARCLAWPYEDLPDSGHFVGYRAGLESAVSLEPH